jgi:hypothetical protein
MRDAMDERSNEGEAGFTLVETLVAIVVLVFGLMAVTNLLLVGATNNTVANHGTAATTAASQRMELLKTERFSAMVPGGSLTSNVPGYSEDVPMAGVGTINVRWVITAPENQLRFITVQAEGLGAMVRTRSRTTLTTFRSCTAVTAGCPVP